MPTVELPPQSDHVRAHRRGRSTSADRPTLAPAVPREWVGQARHGIAVATYDSVDVVAAARVAEAFTRAHSAFCSYEVTALAFETTTCIAAPVVRQWRAVVVPPLDRWLGLSATSSLARWIAALVATADVSIVIGTGLFVLAASGGLDGRTVVAPKSLHAVLNAATHGTTIRSAVAATIDGNLHTAIDADAAVDLCRAIVDHDRRTAARPRGGVGHSIEHDVH